MRRILLLSGLVLYGCTEPQFQTYVGPIDPSLGPQVAFDMTRFVSGRIKPGDGPIQLEKPDGDQAVGPNLAEDLQSAGFKIVSTGGKHHVRYAANVLGDDVVARISVDGADGARMYSNQPSAGLTPMGPFSVLVRGE